MVLLVAIGLMPRACPAESDSRIVGFTVEPESVVLVGPDSLRGLLVHGQREDGRTVDLTHQVSYRSTLSDYFTVNRHGVVEAVADGTGDVEIVFGERTVSVPVQVEKVTVPHGYHFENDIIPVLSKYGCNFSGCHGKAEGQNGFKLSVFGFDAKADYDALVKQGRGRRTFPAAAGRSLLLTKASGFMPHGGGIRIIEDSREYKVLKGWIAAGAPFGDADAPLVVRIAISPHERIVDTNASQQLRVIARYSNGRELDVTSIAKYQSNNDGLAAVDAMGMVRIGKVAGQVAVMANFNGAVDTFQALIPRKQRIDNYPAAAEHNFIDRLVHAKLKKLNIIPSAMADDAEFMRRAYISIVGTLPTAEEARSFLADAEPEKHRRLVNQLLERPEYADYWALKWADMLRVDRQALGHKTAYQYYGWIRQSLAENKPLDRFARDILTLSGPTSGAPQVSFYSVVGGPNQLASTVSQVFLGVRIECAQCHHHPFDRWSQADYYGMTAFFQQVSRKGTPRGEVMLAEGDPETKHPRTGAKIYAHALGTEMPEKSPEGDRREVLADWMTSPDNRWFARNAANRIWAQFMGRGLVEPVDDFRDTNPPSNPELLDALAQYLVEHDFDVKELIRAITASHTYQRSSQPNETNEQDEQNYSRALLKRMDAEVLFDAVSQVTGIDEKFRGVPYGYRAIQLWDSEVDHYFLKLFGRSTRKTVCVCERSDEPTVGQVLHVLNSSEIHAKLAHEAGQVTRLVNANKSDADVVDSLYLTFFARMPNSDEKSTALNYFKTTDSGRRAAAEDLAWSLMNSLEFVFNH
ncbi:MAG: hypothetical protein CMJ64_27240 [Planctomycetaceae bacterium]|nr:hypothetical protein [Planctomycetaceae bacterium]